MSEHIPDNYSQYEAYENRIYQEQRRRPVCSMCHEPIMDDYGYRVKGLLICPDCLDDCKEYISDDDYCE